MLRWGPRARHVACLFGFLFALGMFGSVAAAGRDVGAGPIWNNLDAQKKCPAVCAGAGTGAGGP
jgi:hypothetical protein